ncbi:MICOS complex subunit MIC25 [Suncus etruscus]|uniref:MICOS complex subunit MIC25 n=1 Tax=Suncus etruscus TaxID=109475 RepID=UPI00210F5879|nr:MICOS complex subunit MIC25 [Suncus etruscus]
MLEPPLGVCPVALEARLLASCLPPTMGSIESSEGRRVSFGMDEEERVRVLQGIRLSESVVNRMKDPKMGHPAPYAPPPAAAGGAPQGQEKGSRSPKAEPHGGQHPSGAEEEFKRYKQEQATFQDELFQLAKEESEAGRKQRRASLQKGEGGDSKQQKSMSLAKELENREAELKRRESFFKEQLRHIEKKNIEMYRLSSEQFHEEASKAEVAIKPRQQGPVCSELQTQLLRCYREHAQEVLLCSSLVKAYRRCVSAAAHKG